MNGKSQSTDTPLYDKEILSRTEVDRQKVRALVSEEMGSTLDLWTSSSTKQDSNFCF